MNLFNFLIEGEGNEVVVDSSIFGVCTDPDLTKMFGIIGTTFKILLIFIPIFLVIFGLIDMIKAVMSSKDDEIKAAQKMLMKRIIYTVFAFLLVAIVSGLVSVIDSTKSTGIVDCLEAMF